MVEIEFFPDHLRVIPDAPRKADDPEADIRREAFAVWHDLTYRHRLEVQFNARTYPELQAVEKHRCATDFAYWLCVYGTIFEPRNDRNNLGGGNLPFIPFAKQIELVRFLQWTLTQKGPNADAAVSKTRDVGASWIMCAFALWGWLYHHPWNALLISRKEDLVDSKNARSLFAKIDRMFWNLPPWMRPVGFDPDYHRQKLFLYNPENQNEISGESTTSKTGRGDRATWACFDEAAFIPELLNVWNGISATAAHRWAISTENMEEGPDFYNLRTGNDMDFRPALFELDWWDNPLNAADYAEVEKQRMSSRPADFQREILRNPHGDGSTWVYAEFWQPEFEPNPIYDQIDPMGLTYITFDPGKLDDTAIVILQELPETLEIVVVDAYQNKGKDADFYGSLLSANPDEDRFPGHYHFREEDFMEILGLIPAPSYTGDIYGDTSNGATLDTFYSVLLRYENPQGERITVNRDRRGNKDRGMYSRSRNTFKGRQQSLKELSPHLRFSTRPGAQFVWKCLRNHRFKPQERAVVSEPSAPLHDWTSHIVQAMEFWAVYKQTRVDILKLMNKPQDSRSAPKPLVAVKAPHMSRLAPPQRRATLARMD